MEELANIKQLEALQNEAHEKMGLHEMGVFNDSENNRFAGNRQPSKEELWNRYIQLGDKLFNHGIQQYRQGSNKHKKLSAIKAYCEEFEANWNQNNLEVLPKICDNIELIIGNIDKFSTENQAT